MEKANAAKSQIEKATGSKKISTRTLDLSSFHSIRQFADDFNRTEDKLDILVNNAGIMKHPEARTKDGFEMHFGVNHLGTFLLTNLLLDKMKHNDVGRIVTVSSLAHYLGRVKWTDINWENRRYSAMGAYNASKLMNILFTKELSRRLDGTGITANCVHPGVVRTNLNRTTGEDLSFLGRVTDFVFSLNFVTITPKHGAQGQIYLTIAPELEKVSGEYFSGCTKWIVKWSAASKNNARKLWQISEELTGLKS